LDLGLMSKTWVLEFVINVLRFRFKLIVKIKIKFFEIIVKGVNLGLKVLRFEFKAKVLN